MQNRAEINPVVDRRSILRIAAVTSLAAITGNAAKTVSAQQAARAGLDEPESLSPPRIDCHLHCFAGDDDPRFPYHVKAPYRPPAAATPEHLLHCMSGANVSRAIVVHPEPYQDDHRYLEHCLQVGGGKLKGTSLVFADSPGAVETLTDLVKRMPIVATRIHAYAPDRLPPFGTAELRALWRCAAELGIAVQLHFEPRYAAGFEPLIREFRDTPVIIDHLGRPFQGTPAEHAIVIRWAKLDNTWMKLSSIPATTQYPHRDIQPVIDQLVDAYGPDRMIYGGGFNADATPQSYRGAWDRAAGYVMKLNEVDRAKIFGGNAQKLFFG